MTDSLMVDAPRVLIFGSRNWRDQGAVDEILDLYYCTNGSWFTVIDGCARGADRCAHTWVEKLDKGDRPDVLHFPAQWNVHDRDARTSVPCRCRLDTETCKVAGIRRNARMLTEGRPTIAYGFTENLADSRGTSDMKRRAERHMKVHIIGDDTLPLRLDL